MQNKSKQELQKIIKENRKFKDRTYWAAWSLEEIEWYFGHKENGDMLPPDIYRRNLISHIINGNMYKGDGLFDLGIFELEDIVLQDWAENRRMPDPC